MVSLFNQFKGAKNSFKTNSLRCKIQPIDKFNPNEYWSVDRWWNKEEKIELGIEEPETVMNLNEFQEKVQDTYEKIEKLSKELKELK